MFSGTRNSGRILRGILLAMALPVSVAVPADARSDALACKAPPGTAALLALEKKIIVFGEYHGTREMPALELRLQFTLFEQYHDKEKPYIRPYKPLLLKGRFTQALAFSWKTRGAP